MNYIYLLLCQLLEPLGCCYYGLNTIEQVQSNILCLVDERITDTCIDDTYRYSTSTLRTVSVLAIGLETC